MAAVCLKCGVAGFEELLIFCKSCRIYAEHRYCLDRIPKPTEEDVHWLCCQCCPRVPKARVHTFDNLILKNRGIWSLRHTDHGVKSDSFSKKKRHRLVQSPIPAGTYQNVAKQLNGSSHCVEKDVPSDASTLEILRPRDDKYGDDSLVTSEKDVVSPGKINCEQACLAIDEIKKGKRRKLELDDDSDEDNLPLPFGNDYTDPVAAFRCSTEVDKLCRPLSTPHTSFPKPTFECFGRNTVWRGYFNIHDRKYGPIEAHLSKTACEKVCNVVRTLPQMFHFERVPRLDTWPKSFKLLPPADDSIALYFFPGDMRTKAELDQLLDEVIIYDLALKGIVDEADLLLFSSVLLPQRSHLIDGALYLWGCSGQDIPPRLATPNSSSSSSSTTPWMGERERLWRCQNPLKIPLRGVTLDASVQRKDLAVRTPAGVSPSLDVAAREEIFKALDFCFLSDWCSNISLPLQPVDVWAIGLVETRCRLIEGRRSFVMATLECSPPTYHGHGFFRDVVQASSTRPTLCLSLSLPYNLFILAFDFSMTARSLLQNHLVQHLFIFPHKYASLWRQ